MRSVVGSIEEVVEENIHERDERVMEELIPWRDKRRGRHRWIKLMIYR